MFSSLYRSLRVLREINNAILTSTTEEELLNAYCRIFVQVGKYRMCWIGKVEQDDKKSIVPVAKYGFEEGYLETAHISWDDVTRGRGTVGVAVRTKRPSLCQDIKTSENFLPWREDALKRSYASLISIPIIMDGVVFGTISIYSSKPNDFTMEQSAFLVELMRDFGSGIKVARQKREAEQSIIDQNSMISDLQKEAEARCSDETFLYLATHDPLTGLPNRLQFMMSIESKMEAQGSNFSVLFIDLDYFKQINDHFGHRAGDYVLLEVGHRILSIIRQHDIVARMGGDEYAVIFDNAMNEEDVSIVADRIVHSISETIEDGQNTYSIGASIGISQFPKHGQTPADLIDHADVAMYAAKHNGKNGYCHYAPIDNGQRNDTGQMLQRA